MKLLFPKQDPNHIVTKIKEALGGRSLGDMLAFEVSDKSMTITISKLGTSTLCFNAKNTADGIEYTLGSEKIAFTHKAFKDDVKEKLCRVVEKAGGKVLAS